MFLPIPFPLASGRYEVGPSMRRFGQAGQGMPAEEGHFLPDARLADTLAAKLAVLRRAPEESHLFAAGLTEDEQTGLRAVMLETFRLLAAEHPALAAVDEYGVTLRHLGIRLADWRAPSPRLELAGEPWPELREVARGIRDWLAERQGLWRVGGALGLAVQEDLAIVRGPSVGGVGPDEAAGPDRAGGGADVLEWLHVCLPSNWAPAEKIGRSFGEVHEPVVHSGPLVESQRRIVRAMIHAGPFVRHVWGIHRDGELCHNPRVHRAAPWRIGASPAELADQAWFRVERQTTHGFPGLNRALFTIRYWVEPLRVTVADPWRRERLMSALAGMDDDELAYKGLTGVRDTLVAWLEAGV